MLYKPESRSFASITPPTPRAMSGRRLNQLVKNGSPRDRALLAHDLARGVVQILPPTRAQSAALAHASIGYVGAVGRLTPSERVRVARGELSLSRLHRRQRIATDTEIDRIVAQYGAEAFLRALDRYTQPQPDLLEVLAE